MTDDHPDWVVLSNPTETSWHVRAYPPRCPYATGHVNGDTLRGSRPANLPDHVWTGVLVLSLLLEEQTSWETV